MSCKSCHALLLTLMTQLHVPLFTLLRNSCGLGRFFSVTQQGCYMYYKKGHWLPNSLQAFSCKLGCFGCLYCHTVHKHVCGRLRESKEHLFFFCTSHSMWWGALESTAYILFSQVLLATCWSIGSTSNTVQQRTAFTQKWDKQLTW